MLKSDSVQNNLEQHLALYRRTGTPRQSPIHHQGEKKSFKFRKLNLPPSGVPVTTTPDVRPHNVGSAGCFSKPTASVAPVMASPHPTPTRSHAHWPSNNTEREHNSSTEFKKSPLVSSMSPPSCTDTGHTPPGTSLAHCISSPLSLPHCPQSSIPPSPLGDKAFGKDERTLSEVQLQRIKVMDEVCEMLAEIPSAKITSLFGLSAPFVQKKLALRKKLLLTEQRMKAQPGVALSRYGSGISHDSPICLSDSPTSPHRKDHADHSRIDELLEDYSVPVLNEFFSDNDDLTNAQAPVIDTKPELCSAQLGASSTPLPACIHSSPQKSNVPPQHSDRGTSLHQQLASSGSTSGTGVTSVSGGRRGTELRGTVGSVPNNSHEFLGDYPHTGDLNKIFVRVFGLRKFRPNQLEAINAAILGKDCFILMPTGGGKSLCYQLPALVVTGVTVVVSPLRSLIQDQVQKLCSMEIPACHLSGEMDYGEELKIYTELSRQCPGIRLLYVTPEKLGASSKLQSTLQSLYSRKMLVRFVIDEAHCISQWGHDFRPDYKRLSELRAKFSNVPLMALTATATPQVRADILHQLKMATTKWFTQSFNRTNLQYVVVAKKPKKVVTDIIELINKSFKGQSGIVYCLSRRNCESVSQELSQAGIAAMAYHAGLSDNERCSVQESWVRNVCKVVCATIAFGMGIDKPDVRFVIHHSLAKSIEGYYQEAGRAGRDGRPAQCILFYNYADMARIRRLIEMDGSQYTQRRVHMNNLYRMVQYCENESDCRRGQILEYFAEQFDPDECKNSTTPCDNCRSRVPLTTCDVTSLVKLIVEGVRHQKSLSKDPCTLVQFLDALRGTNSTKPTLRSLPLYGKGTSLSKHDLERLLHMMVLKNILSEDLRIGEHDNVVSYIKLGEKAYEVTSGLYGTILLSIRSRTSPSDRASRTVIASEEDCLREKCYQSLNELRMQVAKEQGRTNPEVVLSVTVLREMAQILPTNQQEMLSVPGLTEAKWKNCRGEDFLKITCQYASQLSTLSPQTSHYFETENQPLTSRKTKRKSTGRQSASKRLVQQISREETSGDEFETPGPSWLSSRTNGPPLLPHSKQSKLPRLLPLPSSVQK